MTGSRAGMLVGLILLPIFGTGCEAPAPAAVQAPRPDDSEARIKSLESLIPDQAHIMADVGEHFANLWFAGRAENWPLADFFLSETVSHLKWAVRRIPIRKDKAGRSIDLVHILEAFENTQIAHLKKDVADHDRARFEADYRESLTACYSCHKAADKPFLRPRVPEQPASPIIQFDPAAKWPQ